MSRRRSDLYASPGEARQRVVLLCSSGASSERFWLEDLLSEAGFDVLICSTRRSRKLPSWLARNHFAVRLAELAAGVRAFALARRGRAVVVGYEPMPALVAAARPAVFKPPPVLAVNLLLSPIRSRRRLATRRVLLRAATNSKRTVITVNAPAYAEEYETAYGIGSQHLAMVPDCWRPGWEHMRGDPWRPDKSYVFVGGIAARDWPTALAAAESLQHVSFVFVTPSGDDLGRESVPANVRLYQDITSERFWELLSDARIVLTPLREARAAGLSVLLMTAIIGRMSIATSTPATRNLIPGTCHETLVPGGDHEALAASIARYWESSESRCRLASQVQEFVLSQRCPEFYASRLTEIINRLAVGAP